MYIDKIEIATVLPRELKKGNKILNVGIVTSIEEWSNVFVVKIHSGCINNVQEEINLPKHHSIKIDSVDGKPCVF